MLRHIFILSLLAALTACGTSPKTKFYQLNTQQETSEAVTEKNQGPAIGVWRVDLPDFLDRSEIVTRNNHFEIELADFSWWADDLENNITSLIASELSQRLHSNRVITSPWSSYQKNDYQIKIHVQRFDGVLGGEAVFRGTWSLLDATGKNVLSNESFSYSAKTADNTYKEMVATLSQLTLQLVDEMASSITAREHR